MNNIKEKYYNITGEIITKAVYYFSLYHLIYIIIFNILQLYHFSY